MTTEPLTSEEIESLDRWMTRHEVEGWATTEWTYEQGEHVLAILRDHARLVEAEERAWWPTACRQAWAERDTLRAQLEHERIVSTDAITALDEAKREVERLTRKWLLSDDRVAKLIGERDSAHAQIEKLREALSSHLLVRQVDLDGTEHDWNCLHCSGDQTFYDEESLVHAADCPLADPTDTGEGK